MISRLLKKTKQDSTKDSHQADTAKLDESLNLLSTTAMEVSQAAINAAHVLQEELHASQSRFYSTIDSIDDLVIIKDGQGRWMTLNHWGQLLYNWRHGEYHNKTDEELKVMYPALRDSLITCQETDVAAWNARQTTRFEEYIPQGTSTYILDVLKTPVFNPDGSRKELIVVGRDVTQIREKQKRTKACFNALNSASDIIFIVDDDQNIFFCNDQFVEVFDFGHYDNVVGKSLKSCLSSIQDYDTMWNTISGNITWEDVYDINYKLTIIPMMNGAPEPIYYVCTLKPLV